MQENQGSQFNVFNDSYSRGFYEFANNISASFFKSTDVDRNFLTKNAEDAILKEKFERLDSQVKAQENLEKKDYYGLIKLTGKILFDVVSDIMKSGKSDVKKSGVNIINGFFEVARKTKDNELLEAAQIIREKAEAAK